MRKTIAITILSIVFVAWMNPEADKAREGNRQYGKKLYDDAMTTYTEVLVDLPSSPRLHFNIGDAAYKKENYEEAAKSFTKAVSLASDPNLEGKIYYNLGNCKYRQGRLKENTNVGKAIELYREALDHYKQAMERYPKDSDIKFNHEFVERRIKELLSTQEQQQGEEAGEPQEGEQGEGEPQEGQQGQQGQQQGQGQQGQEGDQQEGQEGDQQEEQQGDQEGQEGQEGEEGTNTESEEKKEGQAGVEGEEKEKEGQGQKGNLTKQEAKMLLDSLKDEELQRPDNRNTQRQLQRVIKDW